MIPMHSVGPLAFLASMRAVGLVGDGVGAGEGGGQCPNHC